MKAVETVLFTVALLAASLLGNYIFRDWYDDTQIQVATSNAAVCESALASKQTALDTVNNTLSELRERHRLALSDAQLVLGARETEVRELRADLETLTNTIRTTAHADANCAALARLPVCSAVAGRLWPARDASADGYAN